MDDSQNTVTISSEQFQKLLNAAESIPLLQQQISQLSVSNNGRQDPRIQVAGYRLNEPETFRGSRQDLPRFLSQLSLVFSSAPQRFSTDTSRINYAASFLRGTAFTWLQPHLEASSPPSFLLSYPQFTEALRSAFGDPNQKHNAEQSLHALRQKGSASAYTSEFRRLASYTGWNSSALLFQFEHGLKEELKDELAKSDPIDDLNHLMSTVIKIDDRLFERKRAKERFSSVRRPVARNQRDDPHFMDVDSIRTQPKQFKRLTEAEKQHRRDNNLCLYCGEKGHSANECPKRSSGKSGAQKPKGSF